MDKPSSRIFLSTPFCKSNRQKHSNHYRNISSFYSYIVYYRIPQLHLQNRHWTLQHKPLIPRICTKNIRDNTRNRTNLDSNRMDRLNHKQRIIGVGPKLQKHSRRLRNIHNRTTSLTRPRMEVRHMPKHCSMGFRVDSIDVRAICIPPVSTPQETINIFLTEQSSTHVLCKGQ